MSTPVYDVGTFPDDGNDADNDPTEIPLGQLPADDFADHERKEVIEETETMVTEDKVAAAVARAKQGYEWRGKKLHAYSRIHRTLWTDILTERRSAIFENAALIFILLRDKPTLKKLSGFSLAALRQQIINFIDEEEIDQDTVEEAAAVLGQILDDAQATGVVPAPADDDAAKGGDGEGDTPGN